MTSLADSITSFAVFVVVVGVVGTAGRWAERAQEEVSGSALKRRAASLVLMLIYALIYLGFVALLGWFLYSCMTSTPTDFDCNPLSDGQGIHCR